MGKFNSSRSTSRFRLQPCNHQTIDNFCPMSTMRQHSSKSYCQKRNKSTQQIATLHISVILLVLDTLEINHSHSFSQFFLHGIGIATVAAPGFYCETPARSYFAKVKTRSQDRERPRNLQSHERFTNLAQEVSTFLRKSNSV